MLFKRSLISNSCSHFHAGSFSDENWFTFYPSPTSLKLRISRMAQAPDAPQQEQIQALAAPQDAGQPAEPAGQPAAQEPEVFIFSILFSFLFCCRLLPRGSYFVGFCGTSVSPCLR